MTTAIFEGLTLDALAEAGSDLAERLQRGTVAVIARGGASGGSGTIWSADGIIITDNHVAPGARAGVLMWDGREFAAEVFARDRERDLAALRVAANDLPALPAGDSDALRPGQLVFAAGNPNGERGAVTAGIILATGPASGEIALPLPEAVRADIRLAPGNSGGPLADANGRVVGINAMVAGGMGVAVPSSAVVRFLAAGGARPGFLGITAVAVTLPPALAASLPEADGTALMLSEVIDRSAAAAADLLPGDVLLGLDGRQGLRALAAGLRGLQAGTAVRLLVLRGGVIREVEAVPGEEP